MSNHKQANLYQATHTLIEEVAKVMQEQPSAKGKVSKADVVHKAMEALHKRTVKK